MSQSLMPEHAPFVVVAFLGTAGLFAAAAAAAILTALLRKRRVAGWLAAAAALFPFGYAAALLLTSAGSEEKTLGRGDRKYFCEIDCHLAYSIAGVRTAKAIAGRRANGTFTVVDVKTWFDPDTIASFRGNAPLSPNPREAWIADGLGRRYGPSPGGMAALEEERGSPSVPFSRELRPGESYVTTLVFDLPPGIPRPRLFVGDPPGIENALIGHENSPGHKRVYFALE
jgi:hypothetical protein